MNQPQAVCEFAVDQLKVRDFPDRQSCGLAAAQHVAQIFRATLQNQERASVVFGAAPSQNEFFRALTQQEDLDWARIIAFQMDEYYGVSPDDPRVLRNYMQRHFYRYRRPGKTPFLESVVADPAAECARYAALLQEYPLDISCLGIGESCHLAYNDPHVARFDDPEAVKLVEIDDTSRLQQVHDGTVTRLEDAITTAYTLTLPTLLSAPHVSCVAPGRVKAAAVVRTLTEPISEACPSTSIRRHPDAVLFLDVDSMSQAAS